VEDYRAGRTEQAGRAAEGAGAASGHFWARYLSGLCHLQGRRWEPARAELTICVNQKTGLSGRCCCAALRSVNWLHAIESRRPGDPLQGPDAESVRVNRQASDDAFAAGELTSTRRSPRTWTRGPLCRPGQPGCCWSVRSAGRAVQDWNGGQVNPSAYQGYVNLSGRCRERGVPRGAGRAGPHHPARSGAALLYESRARLHLQRQDRAAAGPTSRRPWRATRAMPGRFNCIQPGGAWPVVAPEEKYRRLSVLRAGEATEAGLLLAERFRPKHCWPGARGRGRLALDRYLVSSREPVPEVFRARGLLTPGLGSYRRPSTCTVSV